MGKVDLYLGADLGLWVLQQVSAESIEHVFTMDEQIAEVARSRDVKVWLMDANSVNFAPAKVGFSIHYPRILKPVLISRYSKIYNLHPGYLPWGRGYYPIFWALWENTPAGATLHEITAGVDEGPIVAQTPIDYHSDDTGGSLFQRVRECEKALFFKYWPLIIDGKDIPAFPQPKGGTYHSRKEFVELKRRAKWESMSGRDLVDLVRCLTFPGYTGLEVTLGQRKFEVHLEPLKEA
jgi:methionyl-tRNA formyltransferase